jgi:hypothetical protein
LTGKSAVDCGFLTYESVDNGTSDIDTCAKSAVESGKPFRFGYQGNDDELIYCTVAVRADDGQLWSLNFYVPVSEAMKKINAQFRLQALRCSSIRIQRGRSFFAFDGCTDATDDLVASLHRKKPSG